MTTPQQAMLNRIALSEIPERLEQLRLLATTTPTFGHRRTPDEPTPATLFHTPTAANAAANTRHAPLHDNGTNVAAGEYDNSQSPLSMATSSPDEHVIRQRGQRRRYTATWSPDKAAGAANVATPARSPFQRTPTKMPLTTSMILRSSPRKRLTLGSTPPDPILPPPASPNKDAAVRQQLHWPGTPLVKRLRLGDEESSAPPRPMAQLNSEVALPLLLQAMSQQQLIALIVDQVGGGDGGADGGNARTAENTLRAQLSLPDIGPLEQELLYAKRLIFKSLPTSRLCKKTDSTAYSRAALYLGEFKRLLGTHAKRLADAGAWDALLDYVTLAWPCVRATPTWDSVSHNAVRRQCFKLLACHCIAAVKYGGLRLGAERLHVLERNLREWSKDYEDVLSCVNTLNKTLTKGRTSL